jgi:hypothetical protein
MANGIEPTHGRKIGLFITIIMQVKYGRYFGFKK